MTPEAEARQQIDEKLRKAGWIVQSMKELNLSAGRGVVVREFPTDTGPVDYAIFVDGVPVGVIEAKGGFYAVFGAQYEALLSELNQKLVS